MMKCTHLALLLLLVFGVTEALSAGSIGGQRERCLCHGKLQNRVKLNAVRNAETFPPSAYCPNTEIVMTLKKTGKKICLDPEGMQGKMILKNQSRKKPNKERKMQRGRKQKKRQQ